MTAAGGVLWWSMTASTDIFTEIATGGPVRADAARNRGRILAAAAELFAARGVDNVSMGDVAAAAGVGKGTLYRHFGDRCRLVLAILDERERAFQRALLSGPAPLGPGAAPLERLDAFVAALIERLEVSGELLAAAELAAGGYARRDHPVQASHRHHVVVLLREAGIDDRGGYLAEAILAPLAPTLYLRARREHGVSREAIRSAVDVLLAGLHAEPSQRVLR